MFGGHLASCLIMSCLANRQRLGWGSWLEVIDNIPKYAATLEQPTDTPSVWQPDFVRLLHEVEAIYSGAQDYAKGALYWVDTAQPITNDWFKTKILANPDLHPKIADMNSLVLFR